MRVKSAAFISTARLFALAFFLVGCSASNNQDLVNFMDEIRADSKNRIRIDPLPAYPPYVAVIYQSAGARSPFDPPRQVVESEITGLQVEAPNLSRPKEFLEQFNLAELAMVGSIERQGARWALIKDSANSVHPVQQGNYLGRNYGLITEITETTLDLTETVVNGQGGWIERPRSMSLGDN